MAIYHLSVKAVSRAKGRSATAAAAYRAGCKGELIVDERSGEIYDYTRKQGVVSADIVLPDGAPEWANNRVKLWNAAELAEKRKDACVAREFEVALPAELSSQERRKLALDFAKEMANAEGCAVDVAIHLPNGEHDNRNHHAHILRTTRKVGAEGLGDKLETEKAGRGRAADLEAVRSRWAEFTNEALRRNGIDSRVDHRSFEDQGITDRMPTAHRGVVVDAIQRRGGVSYVVERQATERLERARQIGELERQTQQTKNHIFDLSCDLRAAKDSKKVEPPKPIAVDIEAGKADFAAWFEQQKQIEAGKVQAAAELEQWKTDQATQQQKNIILERERQERILELQRQENNLERQRQADLLETQRKEANTKRLNQVERAKPAEPPAVKEPEIKPKQSRDDGPSFSR